jgi:hypothetical protein
MSEEFDGKFDILFCVVDLLVEGQPLLLQVTEAAAQVIPVAVSSAFSRPKKRLDPLLQQLSKP